jgi:acyl-coenzyme A thioesterase PaaI-like protein
MIAIKPSALLGYWKTLEKIPFGRWFYSRMVGLAVPYSGSIGADVLDIGPGYAKIAMNDRRRVRNHLNSVHAMALVNLAELASGLAMLCGLPNNTRGIVTGFSIEYVKKARGRIFAESSFDPPADNTEREYEIEVILKDMAGEDVATAKAKWLVGPAEV